MYTRGSFNGQRPRLVNLHAQSASPDADVCSSGRVWFRTDICPIGHCAWNLLHEQEVSCLWDCCLWIWSGNIYVGTPNSCSSRSFWLEDLQYVSIILVRRLPPRQSEPLLFTCTPTTITTRTPTIPISLISRLLG